MYISKELQLPRLLKSIANLFVLEGWLHDYTKNKKVIRNAVVGGVDLLTTPDLQQKLKPGLNFVLDLPPT